MDRYTDPKTMTVLLQRGLPGYCLGQWEIEGLRIAKVRRNASRWRNPCPIAVCYALELREPSSGKRGRQLLYAKAFRDGGSREAFARLDRATLATPAYGPPVAHLAEADMVVWSLPNDPGLPQLVPLLDELHGNASLPWSALGLEQGAPIRVETELLRYEPEERASLRCTLRNGDQARVIYGKTFSDERGRDIARRFEHFWQRAATDSHAPLVARPLGYAASERIFWQAAAEGRPLGQALDEERDASPMLALARALAALHGESLPGTPERTSTHWVEEARRRRVKISRALPALADRAARVEAAIGRHAGRFADAARSLIHGDFHIDQVWLQGKRPLFFDFDEFAQGDPLEDLAACLARLARPAWPADFVAALGAALTGEYARCAGRNFDARRLQWHLAVQYLVQASRAFVFQKPRWQEELAGMLGRAELCVAALDAGDGS